MGLHQFVASRIFVDNSRQLGPSICQGRLVLEEVGCTCLEWYCFSLIFLTIVVPEVLLTQREDFLITDILPFCVFSQLLNPGSLVIVLGVYKHVQILAEKNLKWCTQSQTINGRWNTNQIRNSLLWMKTFGKAVPCSSCLKSMRTTSSKVDVLFYLYDSDGH